MMLISVKRADFSGKPTQLAAVNERSAIRFANTCQFCGFASNKHQKTVFMDGDENNVADTNVILACPICHAAFYGGMINGMRVGSLVLLPDIEQATISQIYHASWCMSCIECLPALRAMTQEVIEGIEEMQHRMADFYGKGAEKPNVICDLLSKMSRPVYKKRKKFIGGIRFIPDKSCFASEIEYFEKYVYSDYKQKRIDGIYSRLMTPGKTQP